MNDALIPGWQRLEAPAAPPRLLAARRRGAVAITGSLLVALWLLPAQAQRTEAQNPITGSRPGAVVQVPEGGADIGAEEQVPSLLNLPPDLPPITLATALELALRDNPGLAQIQARAEALAAIPSQVGSLPDPVLSLGALNFPVDSFDYRQEPLTQVQLGVSQSLPFPGKLALREEAAAHEALAGEERFQEARLLLLRDVKATWWQLLFLDRSLEIVARNQNLLRQFVQIAQTKYRVGQGLQQDVLLAQLELSRLLDAQVSLTGARRTEAARLNALLNRRTDRPVRLPTEAAEQLPPPPRQEELFRLAEDGRPLLAEQRRQIDAARSRLELARRDYYPDLQLGVTYGLRGGEDPDGSSRVDVATLRLSVNIPLFAARKQARAVDQRNAELMGERFSLQDRLERVQAEISTAVADYRRAREQSLLLRTGIIPQARQTVQSMLAGYQVNKVDFLNLVNAQTTMYRYETQYWKALAEAQRARARLTAAIGKENFDE